MDRCECGGKSWSGRKSLETSSLNEGAKLVRAMLPYDELVVSDGGRDRMNVGDVDGGGEEREAAGLPPDRGRARAILAFQQDTAGIVRGVSPLLPLLQSLWHLPRRV